MHYTASIITANKKIPDVNQVLVYYLITTASMY